LSEDIKKLFKKGEKDVSEFAGCLGFTDARLLLFPVKSMNGVFAWITCPSVISKFITELELAENETLKNIQSLKNLNIEDQKCYASSKNVIIGSKNVVLEEYTFEVVSPKTEEKINEFTTELANVLFSDNEYWKNLIINNLVILSNNDFRDFVNLSTEVITRTKIDNETGTVADGALFTEEYLPTESIMYSLVLTAPEFAEKTVTKTFETEEIVNQFFNGFVNNNPVMQIGGNATLGKGITKIKMIN